MLREKRYDAPPGALWGFALMPEDAATDSNVEGTAPERQWRQAEVKQALDAAQEAGLAAYRVEIAPDGTISIVVGAPAETPEAP